MMALPRVTATAMARKSTSETSLGPSFYSLPRVFPVSDLRIRAVTLFKHGVALFSLAGSVEGSSVLELEFKGNQMNDVLVSLTLANLGGGSVTFVSYDADQGVDELLEDVAVDVDSRAGFTSLVANLTGIEVTLDVGAGDELKGRVVGVQEREVFVNGRSVKRPSLVILDGDGWIQQVTFEEVSAVRLGDPAFKRDLNFYP